MFNQIQIINQNLLFYLNSLAVNPIVKGVVIIFADLPIFFLPAFLVWYWIYYTRTKNPDKKEWLLFIFYSTIVSIVWNMIIQKFIYIQRPLTFLWAKAHFILKHIPDASFPSDHASVWFAFLVSLYLFWYKKIFYYFLPIVLVMLLSRVIAWVHWPFDILAWMIVWTISGYVVYFVKDLEFIKKVNSYIIKSAQFIKL